MLTKRIIPCLDVTGGRVVKGTHFVDLKDMGDPVALAKRYNEEGADELVFLDITASSDGRNILIDIVEKTAQHVFIPLTVGGGIRSVATMKALLDVGADKVSINSVAVQNPGLIREGFLEFGAQCLLVAIDTREVPTGVVGPSAEQIAKLIEWGVPADVYLREGSRWQVFIRGGRYATGIAAVTWAQYVAFLGAGEILLTSMDRDGTHQGYDRACIQAVCSSVPIPVIASGGAGEIEHIVDVLADCEAALLASLLHTGRYTIKDIKEACMHNNLPIRPIVSQ